MEEINAKSSNYWLTKLQNSSKEKNVLKQQ